MPVFYVYFSFAREKDDKKVKERILESGARAMQDKRGMDREEGKMTKGQLKSILLMWSLLYPIIGKKIQHSSQPHLLRHVYHLFSHHPHPILPLPLSRRRFAAAPNSTPCSTPPPEKTRRGRIVRGRQNYSCWANPGWHLLQIK